ncbi:hypothetical protein BD324DRAFT_633921 [Kockovaella imperatae]|uniref:Uncharacterized protein n=1 Tax=Kockovaella imperatae TaxID=4999 RepID=A0A1Y1UAQ8_9TREE|nr:hypothetical protein BD324DRAFT_633921 [Kockovaella imperatae]ORX35109.1 hypothetical protein BD324DRAFT_633921 [Kockovaella imperatae]
MRVSTIALTAILVTSAQAAVLVERDTCSNGVKICGGGSVSCSGRQCTACNGDKCCTVTGPSDNSCNQATPCVDFSTCTIPSSSGSGSGSGSGSSSGSGSGSGSSSGSGSNWNFWEWLQSLGW